MKATRNRDLRLPVRVRADEVALLDLAVRRLNASSRSDAIRRLIRLGAALPIPPSPELDDSSHDLTEGESA